jgi:drug/metabolite transporter (DMT)-like permease
VSGALSEGSATALVRATPVVFVLIWSTGFVVARLGMPHAQPLTFLMFRYGLSALLFAMWVRAAGVAWPRGRRQWLHLGVVGTLIQAGYLGGVWCAVKAGLGAGLVALIVGLQPVLTALWVNSRGDGNQGAQRVLPLQWLGLALGLSGLLLVVWQKLQVGEAHLHTVVLAGLALLSITVGTLYQKRWVRACDVRSANTVQMLSAFVVTLPLALWEPWQFDPHPDLFIALAWSVLVLTLGGSSLLSLLIQRGAATAVTSLMYLVPPTTAVMAWWLFNETLTSTVFAGMALTAAGVALVVRQTRPAVPVLKEQTP